MYQFRILIVDDEPAIIDEVVTLLEKQADMDLQIHYAYNGDDALSIIQQGRIDLLITDIEMPGLSGVDLMKQITVLWPECKLIILTGYSLFNYAYEAVNAGAVAYILKSESDDNLLAAVHKAFDKFRSDMHTALNTPAESSIHPPAAAECHTTLWLLCHAYQPLSAKHKDELRQTLDSYLAPCMHASIQLIPHDPFAIYVWLKEWPKTVERHLRLPHDREMIKALLDDIVKRYSNMPVEESVSHLPEVVRDAILSYFRSKKGVE